MKNISVAIDGPAGAGKSTISRRVAERLGFIYADTGALYRAIAVAVSEKGVGFKDEAQIGELLKKTSIELRYINAEQKVFLNGEEVGEKLRTPEISAGASAVSALPLVRQFLLELQRGIARENSVVMDGRDIGTVVLPEANIKIFLTASPEERARRRHEELAAKGSSDSYEKVLAELIERDYNDSHRAAAPLKQADDAELCDTTGNTLEQSIEQLYGLVSRKMKKL